MKTDLRKTTLLTVPVVKRRIEAYRHQIKQLRRKMRDVQSRCPHNNVVVRMRDRIAYDYCLDCGEWMP